MHRWYDTCKSLRWELGILRSAVNERLYTVRAYFESILLLGQMMLLNSKGLSMKMDTMAFMRLPGKL